MILHLGNNFFVRKKDIIMILDHAEAMKNKDTRAFLNGPQKKGARVSDDEIKSIVMTDEGGAQKLYYSPISSRTLLKRSFLEALWEKGAAPGEKLLPHELFGAGGT